MAAHKDQINSGLARIKCPLDFGAKGDGLANDTSSIQSAITTIQSSGGGTLLIPNNSIFLIDNLTIPSDVNIWIDKGGIISISAGQTLTIDGVLTAGRYNIFSGLGNVAYSSQSVVYVLPEWRGADNTGSLDSSSAIHLSISEANGIPILFNGTYLVDKLGDTSVTSNFKLVGENNSVIDGNLDVDAGLVLGADLDYIYFDRITFQNFKDSAVVFVDSTSRTISKVTMTSCNLKDSSSGLMLKCNVTNAIIKDNTITGMQSSGESAGVWLGTNIFAQQDLTGKYIVSGNLINDVDSTTNSTESHAIITYGTESIITNNIIEDITNSGNGDNAEAIYTKIRFGLIQGNTIKNGGSGEASINIKGLPRHVTSATQGAGIICTGNNLYSTSGAYNGINIRCDDTIVANNYLEGFGGYAILSGNDNYDNISIKNNKIVDHRGDIAIYCRNYGDHTSVVGNEIISILGSQGSYSFVYGIYVQSVGNIGILKISENVIRDINEASASSGILGIRINLGGHTITNLILIGNVVSITSASLSEVGIQIDSSGTVINSLITKNDAKDIDSGTPFNIDASSTMSTCSIYGNNFWPTLTSSTTSLSRDHSGSIITNGGAVGTTTFQLPSALSGLGPYTFIRTVTQLMRIDPNGSENIGVGGNGNYIELVKDYDSVTLQCASSGRWEIIGGVGIYNYENLSIPQFSDGDTTPSVAQYGVFSTNNTGGTVITNLDDGFVGKTVTIIFGDGNTTIDFTSSSLKGNGGADWSPSQYDKMICTYDGTYWYCTIS